MRWWVNDLEGLFPDVFNIGCDEPHAPNQWTIFFGREVWTCLRFSTFFYNVSHDVYILACTTSIARFCFNRFVGEVFLIYGLYQLWCTFFFTRYPMESLSSIAQGRSKPGHPYFPLLNTQDLCKSIFSLFWRQSLQERGYQINFELLKDKPPLKNLLKFGGERYKPWKYRFVRFFSFLFFVCSSYRVLCLHQRE